MIDPGDLSFIRRSMYTGCITVMLILAMQLYTFGQKTVPVPYVKNLGATRQIFSGGAAGVESREVYLIKCRMNLSAAISNVKATIANEDLPVKIVYRNAEHDNVQVTKGDTFFFRVTKRLSVPRTRKAGLLPETKQPVLPSPTNKRSQSAIIRFTINHRQKGLLEIKSFTEVTNAGRQLEL